MYICVCVYVYIYIYTEREGYMDTRLYGYMYPCIPLYICTHIYIKTHTHIYTASAKPKVLVEISLVRLHI